MITQESIIRSYIEPRKVKNKFAIDSKDINNQFMNDLSYRAGIHFNQGFLKDQIRNLTEIGAFSRSGMDAAFTAPITDPSVSTPIQFLQMWLPGWVKIMFAARKIDELVGIKMAGSWEDEEIVQGIIEPAGTVVEYGDWTNVPLVNWNQNFERRTVVRAEMGLSVGLLEEARSARMRLNSADTKRQHTAIALEIFRNAVGFFGWNSTNERTFGIFNDPSLLPYITSATTGGWAGATWEEIINDIRVMVRELRIQAAGNIDPTNEPITLGLPITVVDYLSVTTEYGISVSDWIKQTYPEMRIVSAPEFSGAHASDDANVAYMFFEKIDSSVDGSSDGGAVFDQLVQNKYMTLGVEKKVKSYLEDYANATAGVMCKRPFANVRMTGI